MGYHFEISLVIFAQQPTVYFGPIDERVKMDKIVQVVAAALLMLDSWR